MPEKEKSKTEIDRLLQDYLNYLEIEKNRSPRTSENYKHYLLEFLKFAKISSPAEITDGVVREFRVTLARRDIKRVTQGYYAIALRNFLKYLAKRDIKTLSAEKIELPKVPGRQIDTLEYGDLERLLAAPKGDSLRALRDKAILEMFFSTGLRLAELCALPRGIDLKRGELSVRGKGDKLRVVFVSDSAREAVKAYMAKRGDAEEKLFVSLDRVGKVIGPITPRAVQRLVAARATQAGIPNHIHAHLLRHSFATDLLVNGADLRSVQELLGHANISTTQVYTHLTNKQLREVHKAFHGARRKDEE
ncbi:MAG TPA: site-specific tyrosine recombinase/integron integrase [Candidatus Paceibacterota bacterium]